MGEAEDIALAASAVQLAVEAGAHEAEATYVVAERFATEARDREIAKLEQSTARTLTLRVFVDHAKSTLTTSDFSPEGLRAFVGEVVDAARYVTPDPLAGLPDEAAPPDAARADRLEIYFGDVRERDAQAKIDDARLMEADIRAYDARITNSSGSRVSDTLATLALANSRGFRGAFRSSTVARSSSPVAQDGVSKRVGSYGSASRSYAALEPAAQVARAAARRAIEMCGARKPATMRVPVIFERDVAAMVLSDIFASLNAGNVAVGNSFLIDKIGAKIGSDLVTIVDDGRLPQGLGTSPFDAEGTPTRRTVVFEEGVLKTYLYDTYYARKLGARTTANAAGGGIGPNNFFLAPGDLTLEELIAATPRGVLVLDTIGFSTESVTGTYSRGARGIMIENGERAYPIEEFTIAGNLATMLAAVDAVADDLHFDSTVASPSFRVAEMTVSGN
ncbi:MAG TPA: TldD/PmbA family protein [Candidatus Acidoferrales bacterium]|nr:TldD/PmbA family protein [Candidatus Acidoferrales bacterium]